ncbi:N-acetyltransferase [Pontibacter sp. E15-1]|uniref:GNAT family N-acetyltransferase n=1 Tax=Pontibacter sp. E15-1 TaxID=2919918 RepID=UPI001F504107|nr:GNAT family N-acetyltransferase [Pontibacter sp. E15-1]MCJ8167343.1 N-acetyltransferase [Pontibacter sp. E15-1]
MNVVHEEKYQQFTVVLGEDEAELAYAIPSEGVMNFTHTYVPAEARGEHVADTLIKEGLRYAAEHKFKVMAACPVVASFLKRHQEYQHLLA